MSTEAPSRVEHRAWLTNFVPIMQPHFLYPYCQGKFTLHGPEAGTYVRLDEPEALLVRAMADGRTSVSRLMQKLHAETGRIAPGMIFKLLGRLAQSGLLANRSDDLVRLRALAPQGAVKVADGPSLAPWGTLLLPLFRDRSLDRRTLRPWLGLALTGALALALLALLAFCAVRHTWPSLKPWFTEPDRHLAELLLIWIGFSVCLSLRDGLRGVLLGLFGSRPHTVAVTFRAGLLTLAVDDRDYQLLPRWVQSAYTVLPILVYGLGALVLSCWSGEAAWHKLAQNVCMVLLFFELSPILNLACLRTAADLTGIEALPAFFRGYFLNKALRFRSRDFAVDAREGVMLALSCLLIVWVYAGMAGLLKTYQEALMPLVKGCLATEGVLAKLPAALVLLGLGALIVAAVVGLYTFLVRALWRAAGDLAQRPATASQLQLQDIDRLALRATLGHVPILAELEPATLETLTDQVILEDHPEGQAVVSEKGENDRLYIILEGTAQVFKDGADGAPRQVGRLGKGDFFGEISVFEHCLATAEVVACSVPFYTAAITRDLLESVFTSAQERHQLVETSHVLHLLGSAKVFTGMPRSELLDMVRCLHKETYEPGYAIFYQGDVGQAYYLIAAGEAEVIINGDVVAVLGEGQYFGEIALLHDVPRTATIAAKTKLEVFVLERAAFLDLIFRNVDTALELEEVSAQRLEGQVQ